MAEYRGVEYLRRKLGVKRPRVNLRYQYYEMKQEVKDFGIATPPDLKYWFSALGWCGKAVDSLADRLCFNEFKNDVFNMNQVYDMNNPDILFDSAMLSALIGACAFLYIYKGADGFPCIQAIDAANATGILDEVTGMLTEGYAVFSRDDYGKPITEGYFVAGRTDYYDHGELVQSVPNVALYPLLVPVIYRPDARRTFGHSRITRACMAITAAAMRTVKRSEIAAEFYSYPQKYVTGLSQEAEPMEKWKATMASMLVFERDENGDKPVLGQFSQQSMTPHADQLKMFASLFAGETGLILDDLGFVTDNPTSSEAIKASHENLRLLARKAQKTFGTGFINAGYLGACIRDDQPYLRRQVYDTVPTWAPIFEPDAGMLTALGDGILKINQAVPDYITDDNMYELTGIRRE